MQSNSLFNLANESQAKPFPCPNCKEFISINSKECRFCFSSIDKTTAEIAAYKQENSNLHYRRKKYLKHLFSGLLTTIILGLVLILFMDTPLNTFSVRLTLKGELYTLAALFVALGDSAYGLIGWLRNNG
jgi:hypothetical protein